MGQPNGFSEIEVGETFFDVLKALLASVLSSLLQVFKIVLQIMYFFLRLTFFQQNALYTCRKCHSISLLSFQSMSALIFLTLVLTLTLELFCSFRFACTFMARLNFFE